MNESTTGEGAQLLPWDERSRLGVFETLISTVKLLLTAPADAFRRLRPDGDLVGPLLFGLVLSWLGVIVSLGWNILFGGAMSAVTGDLEGFGFIAGGGILQAVFISILWPVLYLIMIFLSAGIYQLGLMMVSALDNSEHRFEGTVKVVCYSTVSNVAQVVPFLGSLVAVVIMIVMLIIGFSTVHRTTQGKAAAAVFIPLILCCVCGVLLVVVFGAGLAAFIAGAGG